ncbi:hypothetical protein F5144DRAFT_400818 [Chaetomium tenue]|uniref:Uncharacterized protein n=1 Tax=Chaetomium tenue TaxID=1854479 RepID=A0ACB7NVG0_9PEZI|nr:hypothetical protein F5144DRAFT_400818 [Chaetomium globosum]
MDAWYPGLNRRRLWRRLLEPPAPLPGVSPSSANMASISRYIRCFTRGRGTASWSPRALSGPRLPCTPSCDLHRRHRLTTLFRISRPVGCHLIPYIARTHLGTHERNARSELPIYAQSLDSLGVITVVAPLLREPRGTPIRARRPPPRSRANPPRHAHHKMHPRHGAPRPRKCLHPTHQTQFSKEHPWTLWALSYLCKMHTQYSW